VEIEHFFETYKLLEAKETEVLGWKDVDRARAVLESDRRTFQEEATADRPTPS
jgi:inorganic pyrophosphatase